MSTEFELLNNLGIAACQLEPTRWALEKLALSAETLAAARKQVETSPTPDQKESGRYAKGRLGWAGLRIAIENPKGSVRSGTDSDGKAWSQKMTCDYGYIESTEGNDGDHVDVFVGPELESELVFVINQVDPKSGKFDEHKVIITTTNEEQASELYLSNYAAGWQGLGSIKPMTLPDFKDWLKNGDMAKQASHWESRLSALIDRTDPEGLQWCRRCKELWSDCRCPDKEKRAEASYWEYACPECSGKAYNGEPSTNSRFRGGAKCFDCGHKFSVVHQTPVSEVHIPGHEILKQYPDGAPRETTKEAKQKLDPSYDPEHPEECCPSCGARQERGDNGKCNRCGEAWPEP